jgi:restriction system protein
MLESLLKIESKTKNDCIFSVIIFIGDSTFKTKMPNNVKLARGGINYMKSKTDIVFNNEDVASIVEKIESGSLEWSFKTNRQHVKHVKEIVKEKPDVKSCSKCCAEMVLRKANKGNDFGDAVRFLGVEILSRISEFLLGKEIFVKGL